MKLTTLVRLTTSVALLASVMAAPSVAFAQSGSRLCGWTAMVPNGQVVGLLYEARDKDASYHKQCDEAISKMKSGIDKDPTLKQLQWTEVKRATCESVGKYFTSTAKPSADMCDYMGAKSGYKVVKESAANTTYTKL
jgi:hypothetical protein